MAHLTFIHGIGNKPARDLLLEQWQVALLDDDGLDLEQMGVTCSMVYWADLLYPEPAPELTAQEANALELQESVEPGDADMTWLLDVPPQERAFVERLGTEVGLATVSPAPDAVPDLIAPQSALEAVPLPPWLKRRLMRVFLRDVHHYLYDAEVSPRPGESYRLRRDVRARAVEALYAGAARPGPHVVVGHSLGSVVAYDVLTDRADAPAVDALVTIGSPLGLSEVQSALAPPWTAQDGWPARRLGDGTWTNVADRMDPVCGLDPAIGPDFRRGGTACVVDVAVANTGSWRHSIGKYLGQRALRTVLREALA